MKKSLLALLTVSVLTAVGCGEYSKSPVSDIESLRESGKNELEAGPDELRVQNNEVVVIKKEAVYIEQASINGSFFSITPDPEMTFSEGVESQFKVKANVMAKGLKIKLVASDLPPGATFTPSEKENEYNLTWKPALYSLSSSANMKTFKAKISAQVLEAETPEQKQLLEGLVKSTDVRLYLFRNQQPPTDLAIADLPTEVLEGTQTSFSVTVKVPGVDNNSPEKPSLVVTYDNQAHTAGNDFQEASGAVFVSEKSTVEYVGDFVWKYNLTFDTLNNPVAPQKDKNGAIMTAASGLRVRMNFKVFSPYGMSTAASLAQLKINYKKPAAPVAANENNTAQTPAAAQGGN